MKKTLAALLLCIVTITSVGQTTNDPVIMEVAGRQIRQSEFMQEFLPTVGKKVGDDPTVCTFEKRQALEEYVNLFANFRAKIADAQALGFDTTADLQRELAKYRKELAAPYLIDSAVLASLLEEAYARNHYSLHAAHILVRVRPDAKPDDTLKALEQVRALRQRVMDGEDFYAVAQSEMLRQNPNAPRRPNEGDLGYFTAFDMVYPFETAAYALEVGEVSQPFRTRFGYHIVKLIDKVEMQGKCTLAHIWLQSADSARTRGAAYMIYEQLMNGTPFEQMARQSDDRSTANSGGLLADATLSQLPPEYIHVVQGMKPGEISEPFFTRYGWHIVKLIEKDELAPFESMVPYYRQKMARDQRGEESRKTFAQNSRVKYGIVDCTTTPVEQPQSAKRQAKRKQASPAVMQASLDELCKVVPDSVMSGLWQYDPAQFKDMRPLVKVPGKEYNVLDVAQYIADHQKSESNTTVEYYVQRKYDDFLDSVTIVYADSQLEDEYPEFKALIDEYRRGLMIFNYNDKMIWSKAIHDSTGFADFYQRESQKKSMAEPADSVYFWKTRARVVTIDIADSACLAPAKAKKIIDKAYKKNQGSLEMREALLNAMPKAQRKSENVSVSVDLVERTHQNLLADSQWDKGTYMQPLRKGYRLLVVEDIIEPTIKGQREARGYYLSEYQNELERQLNVQLREKYGVKINWDVVDQITY